MGPENESVRTIEVAEGYLNGLAEKAQTLLQDVEKLPDDVRNSITLNTRIHEFIGYAASAKSLVEQEAAKLEQDSQEGQPPV